MGKFTQLDSVTCPHPPSGTEGGNTPCGTFGTVHRAFLYHKARLVLDPSCGDTRGYVQMWKPFMGSTKAHASKAAALIDKFHVIRHFGEALDKVRRFEYRRLYAKDKAFVKGQRYNLFSCWEDPSINTANKRLQMAYLLKVSFYQLWGYRREGWARRFFDNQKEYLKRQWPKPFEKFAAIVNRNLSGIGAFCESEEKSSPWFVEGVNTKVRVSQRWTYGLRYEEYFPLKVPACMLPEI